uniref:Rhamnogalacturonase A/B/Epimerase-like pectate lyase domain-containing protein n=1 Tax=Chenopodium quinoa TaxID=63459 RepID=A0A803NA19_CHEQI
MGSPSQASLLLQKQLKGKTQLINHFLINKSWYNVDLPGYGLWFIGHSSLDALVTGLHYAMVLFLKVDSLLGNDSKEQCSHKLKLDHIPHSVNIVEFGAVGDGKTLNTGAFQNAIIYLNSVADKGGAQLYVPPGSFNLTSHLTLFLRVGCYYP